jgi:single-strand DNA-binding protein
MLNRIVLVGRMTRDPELKFSSEGTAICNFNIAVNRTFQKDKADFPSVVCFKRTAENTANFTKKGSLVGIDGRLQTRTYDGQNGKVYVTEVVADSVQFLEPKGQSDNQSQNQSNNQQQKPKEDPFAGQDISSDSLPF